MLCPPINLHSALPSNIWLIELFRSICTKPPVTNLNILEWLPIGRIITEYVCFPLLLFCICHMKVHFTYILKLFAFVISKGTLNHCLPFVLVTSLSSCTKSLTETICGRRSWFGSGFYSMVATAWGECILAGVHGRSFSNFGDFFF